MMLASTAAPVRVALLNRLGAAAGTPVSLGRSTLASNSPLSGSAAGSAHVASVVVSPTTFHTSTDKPLHHVRPNSPQSK